MKTIQEKQSDLIGSTKTEADVVFKVDFEKIESPEMRKELNCHITVTEFNRNLCSIILIIERFRNNIKDDNIPYYHLLCDDIGDTIDYTCSMLSQEETVVGFYKYGWRTMIDSFVFYLENISDFYHIYAPELLRIDWYSEKTTIAILNRTTELLHSALSTVLKVRKEQISLPASAFPYWMLSRLTRLLVKYNIISKVSEVNFCNYLNLVSEAKFIVRNCTYFGFVLGQLESIANYKPWFTQACILANIQLGTANTGRSKFKNADEAEKIKGHKQILSAIDEVKNVYKNFLPLKY